MRAGGKRSALRTGRSVTAVALRDPEHHFSGCKLRRGGGGAGSQGKDHRKRTEGWTGEHHQGPCSALEWPDTQLSSPNTPATLHLPDPKGCHRKPPLGSHKLPHPACKRGPKADREDKQKAGRKTSVFLDTQGDGPTGHQEEECQLRSLKIQHCPSVLATRCCPGGPALVQVSPVSPNSTEMGEAQGRGLVAWGPPPAQLPATWLVTCLYLLQSELVPGSGPSWERRQAAQPPPRPHPGHTRAFVLPAHTGRQGQPPSPAAPPHLGRQAGGWGPPGAGGDTSLVSSPLLVSERCRTRTLQVGYTQSGTHLPAPRPKARLDLQLGRPAAHRRRHPEGTSCCPGEPGCRRPGGWWGKVEASRRGDEGEMHEQG